MMTLDDGGYMCMGVTCVWGLYVYGGYMCMGLLCISLFWLNQTDMYHDDASNQGSNH